jgi:hypothetical protein
MSTKSPTKKDRIFELYDEGLNVETIAEIINSSPSYVANTLIESGRAVDYFDLYVTTRRHNRYSQIFEGLLRFKDPEATRESIRKIDHLYHQFLRDGDRRGMYHAQLLVLIGKNRAEGMGKFNEAALFTRWLKAHLEDTPQENYLETEQIE